MSDNVLHSASDLVSKAGIGDTKVVRLDGSDRMIYCQPSAPSNRDCYAYMDLLKYGRINEWFSIHRASMTHITVTFKNTARLSTSSEPVDIPLGTPQVRLGAGLHQADIPEQHFGSNEILNYVLVIQGQEGAKLSKIRLCEGVKEAGEAVYFEALNGYSTVFSAAIAGNAGHLLHRLSTRDPEGLLESISFTRVQVGTEGHRVSRRVGWEYRPTQMRDMKRETNVDVEKGPLKVGFIC